MSQTEFSSPPPAESPSSEKTSRTPLLLAVFSGILLLLTLIILVVYFILVPRKSPPRPLITIHSPGNGDLVSLEEEVIIHAAARDENQITRMEFWVDGTLQDVQISQTRDGISPFPMLVGWYPGEAGEHQLTFRAFNSAGGRAHASITVAAQSAGALDSTSSSDPGDQDGDGVADAEDLCPESAGLPEADGCPDRDGDGIADHQDADPDRWGMAETDGAPDQDGDGVSDREDLSPWEPGEPDAGGAPDTGAGDRDGDGAADDVDPCPDHPGEPEDGYCPPPEENPGPGEDEAPPGGFDGPEPDVPRMVEVEAYSFRVDQQYDRVWCYAQIAGGEVNRYEFEPQGEQQWDIARELAGDNSVVMIVPEAQPMQVMLECVGSQETMGPGGGSAAVFNLGTYQADHRSEEWDGRQLTASGFGERGEFFSAGYRICSPRCDSTAVQPPILDPITMGPRGEGPYGVRWRWEGDQDWLRGFTMMVNGTVRDSVTALPADQFSLDLEEFQPQCGEVLEFQISAYGMNPGDERMQHTPPSNVRIWDGRTCPRTVVVSFNELDGYDLGGLVGPISGTLIANDQMLLAEYRDGPPSFDATDETEIYLDTGYDYNLASLFQAIESEAWSCLGGGCTTNYAPAVNHLEVELGPSQSLTFGGRIWAEGEGLAFEEYQTLPSGEITPGVYTLSQNGINLTVGIDVIVGPEAGGEDNLPDLTITDLTMNDAGQLVVHVFNNAADLRNEDINIAVVQISTSEQIDFLTWEDVTIPAGGERLLVSPSAASEPYDLRLLLDPADESGEGGIRETNESNNVYETPVAMDVQINGFRIRNGPCESFLSPGLRAEFYFRVSVSHRSPDGEITVVDTRRYPWYGVLELDWTDSPWEHIGDWDTRDQALMHFSFEMPADHTLIIHADGFEDDSGLAADDYAGRVDQFYGPEVNYGHTSDEYHFASEGWHDCPDGTPLGWDTNNFHIYWNITRIH